MSGSLSASLMASRQDFRLRDLPLDGEGALYTQIYRAVRAAILEGRVAAGTRLPTSRELARELGISRNTVVSAFEPLRAEGYVVSRVGSGTFVAPRVGSQDESAPRAPRSPQATRRVPAPRLSRFGRAIERAAPRRVYDEALGQTSLAFDFRPCVPDLERLPYEDWRRRLTRTAQHRANRELDYADPAGLLELRQAIAAYLGRARGVVCSPSEIVIVGGVAQALDLSTRLFVERGESVLIENPHYLGARRSFESAGARLLGAPVDAQGIDIARVAESQLRECRLAYLTPSHQYPTGAVLSLARRQALLRWAEKANAYVLEDDYDSEFRYAGRAIEAMKSLDGGDRVIYVGTFSKTLLPSLRIAYLVLPAGLVEVFRTAKWLSDWAAASFEQAALARFLESGEFERHLRRARTLYSAGRAALVDAVDRQLAAHDPVYRDSQAGLHLLVGFPGVPAAAARSIVESGRERGLGLYPATPCYLGDRPAALELVMGFGRLDDARIREGIGVLAELLEDHSPSRVQ